MDQIINQAASSTDWHHQLTGIINWPASSTYQLHQLTASSTNWHQQPTIIINWSASSTDWHQPWPLTSPSPLVGLPCSCLEKEHWAVGKCCTSSCAMKGTSLVRELVQKRPLPWFALPCLGNESSITFKCNCTPTLIYCCLPLTISANHSVEIGIVIETL